MTLKMQKIQLCITRIKYILYSIKKIKAIILYCSNISQHYCILNYHLMKIYFSASLAFLLFLELCSTRPHWLSSYCTFIQPYFFCVVITNRIGRTRVKDNICILGEVFF